MIKTRAWLKARIAELESQVEKLMEIQIHDMRFAAGSLDMSVGGNTAKLLISLWVKFFEDNNGKNFVTTTAIHAATGETYEITVQKVPNESTPAQVMEKQRQRIAELEQALKRTTEGGQHED